MGVKLLSSGGGSVEMLPPSTASSYNITVPAATTTLVGTDTTQTLTNKTLGSGLVAGASFITSGTSVASTSGTAIDFTGIPSWVKRITVMLNGVSTNGASNLLVQIGAGSVATTGYVAGAATVDGAVTNSTYTTGFGIRSGTAANTMQGAMVLANVVGNDWVASHQLVGGTTTPQTYSGAGRLTLGGTLDRLRITTVNGTDTFDAGSINILYE